MSNKINLCVMRKICAMLAVMLMPVTSHAETSEAVIIQAGEFLSTPAKAPLSDVSILVQDGRIARIAEGYMSPAEFGAPMARVINLRDQFVMPGLIDTHVHLNDREGKPWGRQFVDSESDMALLGAAYAEKTLLSGVTTVRDLGSMYQAIFALRDAIDAGLIPGPKILAAGAPISAVGGHGDIAVGFREDYHAGTLASGGLCTGADACRREVQRQVRNGADVIKVMVTGGVTSAAGSGIGQQLSDDELRAIVTTAHALGRRVTAHAHSAGGINAALRAGFDSIEHGSLLDDESLRLFQKYDTTLVLTISIADYVLSLANDPSSKLGETSRIKALQVVPKMRENAVKAANAGITLALGSDAGFPAHGVVADEIQALFSLGLTPKQIIEMATVNAAELLGLSDDIGTLEVGKFADLIALEANPLNDIDAFKNPTLVMRHGQIYRGGRR